MRVENSIMSIWYRNYAGHFKIRYVRYKWINDYIQQYQFNYIYPKSLKCSFVFDDEHGLKIASNQGQQFRGLTIKAHGNRRKQYLLFEHENSSNLTATWINIGIWWIVICSSLWLSLVSGFRHFK